MASDIFGRTSHQSTNRTVESYERMNKVGWVYNSQYLMEHRHVKHDFVLDTETGRISMQIMVTLIGGTLLLCSVVAQFLFDSEFYAAALGLIAALLLGAPLIWVAVKELLHGHTHMNELVALGVMAAMAIGHYQEAAAIAFFMIISVLVENRTALGAQASIESLVRITPTRAYKIKDGHEIEVDAKDLRRHDVVRVRPGDNIPADGEVVSGTSTVNQATITGESLPVEKTTGNEVFGGTINLTGLMDIKVTKAGRDATLGRVKDLILQAERTRIPIMRMIDNYASWYTPTVVMLVATVLFFTLGHGLANPWERAISMLVVACPCALILATPTAMVAGLSSAARLGVLVKSVVDFEAAKNLTAMIFDKTGTLTTGELKVTRLTPAAGVDGVELLRVAASIEQNSKHPVAGAVVGVAREARLELKQSTDFSEVSGYGVRAIIDGKQVWVGRASWFSSDVGQNLEAQTIEQINHIHASPEAEGLSVLFVVHGEKLLGWIGLEDNTRPEAAAAIDRLRELGLKHLTIVTGDRESVAKRVASQMHTDYRAEVLPQQKLRNGRRVKKDWSSCGGHW